MRTLLTVLFIAAFSIAKAQNNDTIHRECGFGYMRKLHGLKNTDIREEGKTQVPDNGNVFTIPVVFHVIYEGAQENLPDSVLYSQIEVLNEDFGRYRGGSNSSPLSADASIRFCLATIDPDGNPTTGITRTQSPYAMLVDSNELATKSLSDWDHKRYLNIWTVKCINECSGGGKSILGYTYLPKDLQNMHNSAVLDGVVLNYQYVGRNNKYTYRDQFGVAHYDLGHTCTHEVGHYLNLLHTWGGDDFANGEGGCDDDDGVDDTPDCYHDYYAKYYAAKDSCDQPYQCGFYRLTEDYMDYSEDHCLRIFTKGQIARMRSAIQQYRSALVTYENLISVGCNKEYRNTLAFDPTASVDSMFLYPSYAVGVPADIYVFDELGREVRDVHIPQLQSSRQLLPELDLPGGIYYFRVLVHAQAATQISTDQVFSSRIFLMRKK
jgi:hypothetical protein